jgi:hypothetical protein
LNSSKIPYAPLSTNSNAAARYLIDRLGVKVLPGDAIYFSIVHGVSLPGYNTLLWTWIKRKQACLDIQPPVG